MRNGAKKLEKCRHKTTQHRLDAFFKPVASPTGAAKRKVSLQKLGGVGGAEASVAVMDSALKDSNIKTCTIGINERIEVDQNSKIW